jgi:integrase
MPLKLIEPKAGRTPNWHIRGTYLGTYVNQSTGSTDGRFAAKKLREIKEKIERGELRPTVGPTWDAAVMAYIQANKGLISKNTANFLDKLTVYWRETPLADMNQISVDACAATLYPKAGAATRNRQVYTPMMAVAAHVKHKLDITRPKGGNGKRRTCYLPDDQLFRLLDAADARNPALGALMALLAYCGPRLSEALSILCDDVDLSNREARVRDTKNGEPQVLHLPPHVVVSLANLPLGLDRPGERVFRQWTKGVYLRKLMLQAYAAAGVAPQGAPAHILRHTYATNMTRLGVDLMRTGRWKSRQSSDGYVHVSGEARKADLLPTRAKVVQR